MPSSRAISVIQIMLLVLQSQIFLLPTTFFGHGDKQGISDDVRRFFEATATRHPHLKLRTRWYQRGHTCAHFLFFGGGRKRLQMSFQDILKTPVTIDKPHFVCRRLCVSNNNKIQFVFPFFSCSYLSGLFFLRSMLIFIRRMFFFSKCRLGFISSTFIHIFLPN